MYTDGHRGFLGTSFTIIERAVIAQLGVLYLSIGYF